MLRSLSKVVLVTTALFVAFSNPATVGASASPNVAGRSHIFVPKAINRTPIGGKPTGKHPAIRKEVVSKRTRTSTTFAVAGAYQVVAYPGSINYQDSRGNWQPIDNSLVPDQRPGYGYRNRANRYSVEVPTDLSGAAVRITDGQYGLSFQLSGARGGGSARGDTMTYPSALDKVAVSIRAGNDVVKEGLTLSGPAAGNSFTYNLGTAGGLLPRTNRAGGIDFLTASGAIEFSFLPPYMYDAAGARSEAVKLSLSASTNAELVTIAADPAWLSAPGRKWPVIIDPTTTITGDNQDCMIESAADQNNHFCGNPNMNVGWTGSEAARSLIQYNFYGSIPRSSTVTSAYMSAYGYANSNASSVTIGAYQLTQIWDGGATWNENTSVVGGGYTLWNTPGGTFNSSPLSTTTISNGATGWFSWTLPANVVQQWAAVYDDQTANEGVLLKQTNENVVNTINFYDAYYSSSSYWPTITVTYNGGEGDAHYFTYYRHQLDDRMNLEVNVGNGDLVVHNTDLSMRGVGLNLTVDRYFNNTNYADTDLGNGWTMGTGWDVYLIFNGDGSVTYIAPSNAVYDFPSDGHGGWNPATGLNARLSLNSGTYTIRYNQSGEKYNFDSNGFFTSDVDRNGNTISFAYDSSSRLASITDTEGRVTTFTYGNSANTNLITQMTDPAGRTYQYGYDSSYNLTTYTDAASKTTQYSYDGGYDLVSITDPNQNETIDRFTAGPSALVTSVQYITNPTQQTGPTTGFNYVNGTASPCTLSNVVKHTILTDANNHSTTYCLDSQNRVVQAFDALNHQRQTTYDSNSNVTQLQDALSAVTQLTYDNNNNLTQITAPRSDAQHTAASSNISYHASGQTYLPSSATEPESTTANANGNCQAMTYDAAGNLQTVYPGLSPTGNPPQCDGQTGSVAFTNAYQGDNGTNCGGKNGELCSSTDAKNNKTSYGYDSNGNLTSITPPTPLGSTAVTYDGLSRISTVTDGNGNKTTYSYDALDRIVQILYAGATTCLPNSATCITYTYDADGNLTNRSDNTGNYVFTYDALNRVLDESLPDATTACTGSTPPGLTFGYDNVGNLTSYCDAGGTTTYAYDAANRLTNLAEPTGSCTSPISLCTTFSYDSNDRRTQTTFPGGATLSAGYNSPGQQTSAVGKNSGGSALTSFSYTYSLSSQDTALRQTVAENDPIANLTTTYTYDSLDRLLTAANSSTTLNYSYDQDGNRCSTTTNCSSPTYQYNGANELTSSPGVSSYSYDQNGNMTGNSAGASLSYNAKNQPTAITDHGGTLSGLSYADADQTQRTAAGSSTYANSPLGVIIEKTGASSTYYVRDNQGQVIGERTPDGNHWYFLKDGLGSVIDVISGDGSTVADQYAYDPYGQVSCKHSPSCSVNDPWQFAGGYLDSATSLVKFGTRFYDPTLGRWTQQDPLAGSIARPFTVNRYLYAADNPGNAVDQSGAACNGLLGAAALAGVVAAGLGLAAGAIALGLVAAPVIAGVTITAGWLGFGAGVFTFAGAVWGAWGLFGPGC